ncbi:PSMD9 [Scenedesmus sp. PABB004]|nr:PSMD9 [Scenedesmus sp. PABB004]
MDALKAQIAALSARRAAVEAEIAERTARLDAPGGPGMAGSLVDKEGFPRADIDVAAARADRCAVIRLANDHKDLSAQLEAALHALHALAREAGAVNVAAANGAAAPAAAAPAAAGAALRPFAVVDELADGGPAAAAGLQLGDQLCRFGAAVAAGGGELAAAASELVEGRRVSLGAQRARAGGSSGSSSWRRRAAARTHALSFRAATAADLPYIRERLLAERMNPLKLSAANFTVAEAEPGGGVLGFAQLDAAPPDADGGPAFEFRSLIVAPEHRGRGVGRALLERVAGGQRAAAVYLTTISRTVPFYTRAGFELLPPRAWPTWLWFEATAGTLVARLAVNDVLAARECGLGLAAGTTALFVADPGTFSSTPEATFYLANLKNNVTLPSGAAACPQVVRGKLLRQDAVVVLTGIGPMASAVCVFDVLQQCGKLIKDVIYSGTSGWSSQLGGVINNGSCNAANGNGKITRLGDVCVSPLSVNWDCRQASWQQTSTGHPNQCTFPEQNPPGPASSDLFGVCMFPNATYGLANEVARNGRDAGKAGTLPIRNAVLQSLEEEYWTQMSKGTNLTYPVLKPNAPPRVWGNRECMEIDSQFFFSGAPWDMVSRAYIAQTMNAAFGSTDFNQSNVVAVSAMEAIGLSMAVQRYNGLSGANRRIPFTVVRGMSDWLHSPLIYKVARRAAAPRPYAIATASAVVLTTLQVRCEAQFGAGAPGCKVVCGGELRSGAEGDHRRLSAPRPAAMATPRVSPLLVAALLMVTSTLGVQAARECGLGLAAGTTALFVADPGTFSATPEAAFYLANLKNNVTLPSGAAACPEVVRGKLLRQDVVVVLTGIGPMASAVCIFDVLQQCGKLIKDVIYSGTSGWSPQLGGVINNGSCNAANGNGKITRLGDVCVSPLSVNWDCRQASWQQTSTGHPNQCTFPEQNPPGPASSDLFGVCMFPNATYGLANEVARNGRDAGKAGTLPIRNAVLQSLEEEYWTQMSKGTGINYPVLKPNAAPRVWGNRECMEIDSQYFFSGAPWEMVARSYVAETMNAAFGSTDFNQTNVIAVSAMEAIGLSMAVQRYNGLSGANRRIPFTVVRGMSNWLHTPLIYKGNGDWEQGALIENFVEG